MESGSRTPPSGFVREPKSTGSNQVLSLLHLAFPFGSSRPCLWVENGRSSKGYFERSEGGETQGSSFVTTRIQLLQIGRTVSELHLCSGCRFGYYIVPSITCPPTAGSAPSGGLLRQLSQVGGGQPFPPMCLCCMLFLHAARQQRKYGTKRVSKTLASPPLSSALPPMPLKSPFFSLQSKGAEAGYHQVREDNIEHTVSGARRPWASSYALLPYYLFTTAATIDS